MSKFIYKAKNSLGKDVSGSVEAVSETAAIANLNLKGFSQIKLSKSEFGSFLAKLKKNNESGKVSLQELAIVARQLATLVNAGVNVLEAVLDISTMVQNTYFSEILFKITEDIKSGLSLSVSLAKYPKIFDNTFVSMVAVGENSGQLAKVLSDLALHIEKSVKLRRKIKSAASYPIFVGSFFVITFIGIVFIMIPKFDDMFKSFGAQLPLPTQIVVNISNFCASHILLFIIFFIALFVAFKLFIKNPKGLLMWHKFLFNIPKFSPIYTKMIFASFFQVLSTLLKSGVDIVSSIQIATNTVNNTYLKSILEEIKENVVGGAFFSAEMDKHILFPKMVVKMAAVGEKSGQLDELFLKITDYYQDEVDTAVASISAIVEPVLIVGLGFMVGVCVVALYLPIFNMANAISSGT